MEVRATVEALETIPEVDCKSLVLADPLASTVPVGCLFHTYRMTPVSDVARDFLKP